MSRVTATTGPLWPRLGRLLGSLVEWPIRRKFAQSHIYQLQSPQAQSVLHRAQAKLAAGDELLLAGLGLSGHNSGASLIRATQSAGIEFLASDEEERFTGIKHYSKFPEHSLRVFEQRLQLLGKQPRDVDAWCLSWDYIAFGKTSATTLAEQLPFSWRNALPGANSALPYFETQYGARSSAERLTEMFQLGSSPVFIAMPHHGNHAAFPYAVSPFAHDGEPTLVLVIDGMGDRGSVSIYRGDRDGLHLLYCNESVVDSLGVFYTTISSTQGGWTCLSSEGRYMGAAAWGDGNRLSNKFYRLLRELLHFGQNGAVLANRKLANWQNSGELDPYQPALAQLIGPPIPQDQMWNPDAVLNVDDVDHAEVTQDRVDLAAATQLVFEDALAHILDHWIRTTGIDRLVISGGAALNCVANMQMLDCFDRRWYQRHLGRDTQLQLWVPPVPGDAGVSIGAACQFAFAAGAKSG
ncbi:MAG: hypothetical protein KDA58_15975, partial [Planctomycetaceae bacterium]|nr:hypothetical protein [Planctomycetaceae bacterium]